MLIKLLSFFLWLKKVFIRDFGDEFSGLVTFEIGMLGRISGEALSLLLNKFC